MRSLKAIVSSIALVSVFVAGTRVFCLGAEAGRVVEDLSGAKYFPRVVEALRGARRSISLVMYLAKFEPGDRGSRVSRLVGELVAAHRRGVKVRVILDQNIDFYTLQREDKNDSVYAYLKKEGIEVYFDELYRTTHSKAMVIDESIVVMGSANWSDSSLEKNSETSCLIYSEVLAKEILADFSRIPIDYEAILPEDEKASAVVVSDGFIKGAKLGPRMVAMSDGTGFDLYLWLLKNYDGNAQGRVDVDYTKAVADLGLGERMGYDSAREMLRQALVRLENDYGLIVRTTVSGKDPYCVLKKIASPAALGGEARNDNEGSLDSRWSLPPNALIGGGNDEEGQNAARSGLPTRMDNQALLRTGNGPYSGGEAGKDFYIPSKFWEYGWNKRLSLRGKLCLLINLSRTGAARGRVWAGYRKALMAEFHATNVTISEGMGELRRLGIIEIEYAPYPEGGGYAKRAPVCYRYLGLYSPEVLAQEKARLVEQYGKERFERAERYAGIVFRGCDVRIIEEIIKMVDQYGVELVDESFGKLAVKSPSNPKRSYRYVVGIVEHSAL